MIIENWPTAFVLIATLITGACVFALVIDKNRPESKRCCKCEKEFRLEQYERNCPDE